MRVLGVDTATSVCSVGIAGEGGFEADYRINRGYIHGEYLSIAIKEVLKSCDISLKDIDGFAVSIGPGSFTGLRIGLAVIKGIMLGEKRPVAAVPTMDGLIHQVPPISRKGCVMLVARKKEVYQGIYRYSDGRWKKEEKYQVVNEKDIGKGFSEEDIVFIGNGTEKFFHEISDRVDNPVFLAQNFSLPSGFGVAGLGREMIKEGKEADIESLVPLYVKSFKGIM
ncbi:MAG: tRNA (adenosine(37)-N6)-threonylcarbamoyltransferase complex dimerization subunit type 1 TsaB [bacterium]